MRLMEFERTITAIIGYYPAICILYLRKVSQRCYNQL